MNDEQTSEPTVAAAAPAEPAPAEPVRAEPPAQDPRRRLKELLAIPDHQRSDAIWDEIIELEISLAPGNRIHPGGGDPGRRPQQGQPQNQGRRQDQPRRQDGNPGNKPAKRFFKKPKRPPGALPKT